MAALAPGKTAPDFTLPIMDGAEFSLRDALAKGPVILAFFKISCPVCQYAFPYFERMYQRLRGRDVTIIGVSQNKPKDTAEFLRTFGITFPIALDNIDRYEVSNAYGLTNVPTLFEISQDGIIRTSSVGWSKTDLEQVYRRLVDGQRVVPLYNPGEQVVAFKAG